MRHQQLIKKNKQKHQSLPENIYDFLNENVSKGMFKDLFTQYDEEQEDKL